MTDESRWRGQRELSLQRGTVSWLRWLVQPADALRRNVICTIGIPDHVVGDGILPGYGAIEYLGLIAWDVPSSDSFAICTVIDGIDVIVWWRVALPDVGVEDLCLGAGVVGQTMALRNGTAEPSRHCGTGVAKSRNRSLSLVHDALCQPCRTRAS